MSLALVTMSHSPLLDHVQPPEEVTAEVNAAFDRAREFARDFDPELIINFGPDHYNGFFYELMPAFCVGYEATSIGDYGSQAGRLDVPGALASELAQFVMNSGVDVAVSLRMEVDHGAVQPLEIIFGDIAERPVIPVFINSVAPPYSPMSRVRLLGEAIGRFATTLDKRVLFLASGGLSHDPPVPRLETATEEQRATLVGAGRHLSEAARTARETRVIETAKAFARGEADIQDLAPDWDQALMKILASGDLTPLDAWEPAWMDEIAGHSSHEVRTWIAGYAALGSAGRYEVGYSYYRPIKEYIAGFGITTARPV